MFDAKKQFDCGDENKAQRLRQENANDLSSFGVNLSGVTTNDTGRCKGVRCQTERVHEEYERKVKSRICNLRQSISTLRSRLLAEQNQLQKDRQEVIFLVSDVKIPQMAIANKQNKGFQNVFGLEPKISFCTGYLPVDNRPCNFFTRMCPNICTSRDVVAFKYHLSKIDRLCAMELEKVQRSVFNIQRIISGCTSVEDFDNTVNIRSSDHCHQHHRHQQNSEEEEKEKHLNSNSDDTKNGHHNSCKGHFSSLNLSLDVNKSGKFKQPQIYVKTGANKHNCNTDVMPVFTHAVHDPMKTLYSNTGSHFNLKRNRFDDDYRYVLSSKYLVKCEERKKERERTKSISYKMSPFSAMPGERGITIEEI